MFAFGAPTDLPVIGDWNGDGFDDFGVRRNNLFFLDLNGDLLWDPGSTACSPSVPLRTCRPSETGMAMATMISVSAPQNLFYLDLNGNRIWDAGVDTVFAFGLSSDTPVTGKW